MRHVLRRTTLGAMVAIGLALAAACGGSAAAPPAPTVTITSLGWIEENIDPSFWSSPPGSGQTAFYDFWIHYSGNIAFTDIQSARVYLPSGSYWTLSKDQQFFDAANRTIGGYGRWFDNTQLDVLPIGFLVVEVKLVNGTSSTYAATIPAPGSLTAAPYTIMNSEDVTPPPGTSAPMVRRASAGATNTVDLAAQAITITFSVTDPKVHDGFVWFFDAANNYLGGYFYFRDAVTGLINPTLADTLATDGAVNTLTLHPADITFSAGASFAQITRFRLGLLDGAQYLPQASGRTRSDCRSISAIASLTLQ
jgi:hypothetical protein